MNKSGSHASSNDVGFSDKPLRRPRCSPFITWIFIILHPEMTPLCIDRSRLGTFVHAASMQAAAQSTPAIRWSRAAWWASRKTATAWRSISPITGARKAPVVIAASAAPSAHPFECRAAPATPTRLAASGVRPDQAGAADLYLPFELTHRAMYF